MAKPRKPRAIVKVNTGSPLKSWPKTSSSRVGQAFADVIRDRTSTGTDAGGKPFDPYEPRYAKDHPGPVDLRVTGAMLESIRAKYAARKGEVSEVLVLGPRYGYVLDATRKFLGLLEGEADGVLMQIVVEEFDKAIKASNKRRRGGIQTVGA